MLVNSSQVKQTPLCHTRPVPAPTSQSIRGRQSLDEILAAIDPLVLQVLLGFIRPRDGCDVALEVRVAEIAPEEVS